MPRILYLQYFNPAAYPPLIHSSRILAKANWSVTFLGIRTPETDRMEIPVREGIRIQRLSYCSPGWRQKLHYLWFAFRAVVLTLRWRPNWVYVSDPLSSPAGWLVSWLPQVDLVYHEHDSPSEKSETLFMRLICAARKSLAQRARFCIIPNQQRAAILSREIPKVQTHCVWNCPSVDEIE